MSSSREVITSADAPKPIGPFSQAIKASGNLLFVSGQIGSDPKTGDFASPDVEGQAKQALENMGAILKAGGSSFAQVVKTTVLLRDMNDFAKVNAVYGEYFPSNPPARMTYAVAGLPKNALVEIEAVALSANL
eukprot:TRINITY_DN167_c0_g1_i1.p1 TRINITY_DN167_c0_g1~~TRINITY_DN167_c0_g1_i1.p1  ORF type:complete len:133 (+),score=46.75 TRINITY_DN167_c0_g1_i1:67-465(+)